jgi:DNA-binding NtrC family response regulator
MKNPAWVLIVDDEPDMCWALESILRLEGYQTLTANTAQEALALAGQDGPLDVALIDVVLPDMNGIELAALIRKARPEAAIIVTSGHLTRGDKVIEEGVELGTFSVFVGKPFDLAEVRLALKRAVKRSETRGPEPSASGYSNPCVQEPNRTLTQPSHNSWSGRVII